MVRQYSNSFRPAWAVKVPAHNVTQPETEALGIKPVEETGNSTDRDSTEPREESRDGLYPSVASESPSQESKPSGRCYSKVFPSSWTLPRQPKLPPTNIIDYGNPAGSIDRTGVPGAPQKPQYQPGPRSYSGYQRSPSPLPNQSRHNFSAESGEGEAAPRPPEGYKAGSYSATLNHRYQPPQYDHRNVYYTIPNPPTTTTSPWQPWHADGSEQGAPRIGYDHPPYSADTPHSVASVASESGDVPARAPVVSPAYSSTL